MGIMTNSWRVLPYPTPEGQVGGHEGVGVVHKLGPGADQSKIKLGDRVGIKWVAKICMSCAACHENRDAICFDSKVSGYYHPGTFQQYVCSPANYVTPIPDGLSSPDAAPMLCAGLTTYSALRKAQAKAGDFIVVAGAGGGLGHLAVQIASRGMAMRVIGIDHGSKEKLVKDSGAEHFFDITKYKDDELSRAIKEKTNGLGASAVIVCTAVNKAYAQALSFLRFGGTVVCVGIPEGDMEPIASAYPAALVMQELRIVGSAVGTQWEALQVLDLAARGLVKTHYRTEKMEKLTEIFKEMDEGKLQGRVVLDLE